MFSRYHCIPFRSDILLSGVGCKGGGKPRSYPTKKRLTKPNRVWARLAPALAPLFHEMDCNLSKGQERADSDARLLVCLEAICAARSNAGWYASSSSHPVVEALRRPWP